MPRFDAWVQKARAVSVESVIAARGIKLKRQGKEHVGPCPHCAGTDRFAINVTKNVFNCRQCGAHGDVIELVQFLDGIDFKAACQTLTGERPPTKKPNGKDRKVIIATYDYTDENGALLFQVLRYSPKAFRQRAPDGKGGWVWNLDDVQRVLFKLPAVIEAVAAGQIVYIAEGEKDVLSLNALGLTATCNPGGAGKWRAEYSEFLRGADVMLLPDADDAGHQHAQQVGAALHDIAKRVRVLVLPAAKDVTEWLGAGHTVDELDALVEKAPDWQPFAVDQANEEAKAAATKHEDELLNALAKTEGLDYFRQRKAAAKELGVSPSAIDNEVRTRREDAEVAPLYGHWIVDVWPETVEGDSLLRDIILRIRRHVVIDYAAALAVALWVMLSWVHDAVCVHSPILVINSPEPESGKTTLMGINSFLMPRCIASVEVSEAALYRSIKRWAPSFCFDEFDTVLADDAKAALRSVINSGHTRGQGVLRCVGDDKVPELFITFAAKCLSMIGRKLPPATLSRCIFVALRRRREDEAAEDFGFTDDAGLANLRSRLRRWALDNEEALRAATPGMPPGLRNRKRNNWLVQFAIADLCDGVEGYGEKARAAAIAIEGGYASSTKGAMALAAIKAVIAAETAADMAKETMGSEALVELLAADPNSVWAEWQRGKPISQAQLAGILKDFGIFPKQIRVGGRQIRGYVFADFRDAFERYL